MEEIKKHLFDLDTTITMHRTTIQVHENANMYSKEELKTVDNELTKLQEQFYKVIDEIRLLEKNKTEIDEKRKYAIESGTSEDKIKNMKDLLDEAKFEYDNRSDRFNKLNSEIELLIIDLKNISYQLAEASLNKENARNIYNRALNRKELLENILKDPFSSQSHQGVKVVMENKSSLYGIMGVVGQEIHPCNDYEIAIWIKD